MHLSDLINKKIAILGYGFEGQAIGRFLQQNNLSFARFDQKDGSDYLAKLSDYQVVFHSPGVPLSLPEISAAQKKGVVFTSQIKFFFENCSGKIIGVTGSKGKGTTAQLIYEILQHAGLSAYLAGNIGIAAIDLLGKIKPEDYVILELSSFQLQDLELSPHIAVVLMVVPEHLDYHENAEQYTRAKTAITRFQSKNDYAVINYDYPLAMQIGKLGAAKKFFVQTVASEELKLDPFTPYKPEDFVKIKEGVFAEELHHGLFLVQHGALKPFCATDDFHLRGFHNAQNLAAAVQVAKIVGVSEAVIFESISAYKGLEHRLEFVAEKNGVKFYNDSIGTTPQSALAAVKSFIQPEIVIIGGVDKKVDYENFAAELCKRKNIKAIILIGAIAGQMQQLLKKNKFSGQVISLLKSMAEIFDRIKAIARPGDVVLLAPGTSSFDMFKDYKERGREFKEQVAKI